MELVAGRLEDNAWPELDEILKREGVTLDDLGEACGAYCKYLTVAVTAPEMSMHAGMELSGFFDCYDWHLLCRDTVWWNPRSDHRWKRANGNCRGRNQTRGTVSSLRGNTPLATQTYSHKSPDNKGRSDFTKFVKLRLE
jgi:hypothetical protein